jgi:Holliday junction resolvasome RuvABC endonuclease subunit
MAALDRDVYLLTSKVPPKVPRPEAYGMQVHAIRSALSRVRPDIVVMEGPAYGAGSRNMEQLAVVRGLIELLAWEDLGLEVARVAPTSLKKRVTGDGRATKAAVFSTMCNYAAERNWTLPANEDEADALGLLLIAEGML